MKLTKTAVAGAYLAEPQPFTDERGFLVCAFSREEFEQSGLNGDLVQCNISYNIHRGTLRGLHYQAPPHQECKLVRCTRGAIYDVVVDLRKDSPTYLKWAGIELTAENRCQFYVPEGCAHGFLTLRDDTEVFYQISAAYHPESARGVRWNDPAFGIYWPEEIKVIIARDANYPDFRP